MSVRSLEEFLMSLRELKVLIIGDVMVDQYIYGSASRISAEAPVPIVNVTSREQRLGGAANVALNIQSMGAHPVLCSIIGDDHAADQFVDLLKLEKIETHGIIRSVKRKTTVKNRIIAAGHQMIRFDDENEDNLDEIDRRALLSHIAELIKNVDVVILEDYDKGCLDKEVIQSTIDIARSYQIPVTADPKIENFFSYRGATLFKPNLAELRAAFHTKPFNFSDDFLERTCQAIFKEMNCEHIMVTMGDRGIYCYFQHQGVLLKTIKRKIADVSGAGDTVIAVASLCIAKKSTVMQTAMLSNLAGGIVCEQPGVIPIDFNQLLSEALSSSQFLLDWEK